MRFLHSLQWRIVLGVCLKIPRSVLGGGCDVQYWWWSGLGSESRIGPVGSFTLAAAPRKGPAGQDLAFQARFDEPAATGFALHSFSRLWVKDTRVNSPATLWMPRSRNCLKPRTCLVSPWTGSVMTLRRAYTSRPSGVCSLDRMAERSGVLTFTC